MDRLYKTNLFHELAHVIDKNTKINLNKEISDIIFATGLYGFYYEGKLYPEELSNKSFHFVLKELDPKYYPEMKKYILHVDTVNIEKRRIATYLRKALNICVSTADISFILPTFLFDLLSQKHRKILKKEMVIDLVLTNEEKREFNLLHLDTINLIKSRIMTNLLLEQK